MLTDDIPAYIMYFELFDLLTFPELPVLSSLVIQDHHSAPLDSQYPVFSLRKRMGHHDNVWQRQMDQLFVYKMSEVMRVLLTLQLLLTGPEVEKGFTYSEVCCSG